MFDFLNFGKGLLNFGVSDRHNKIVKRFALRKKNSSVSILYHSAVVVAELLLYLKYQILFEPSHPYISNVFPPIDIS